MRLLFTPIALTLLFSFTAQAADNSDRFGIQQQPIAIQIAAEALRGCMAQYLDESTMAYLEQRIDEGIKHVQAYCKQSKEEAAYRAVQHYAKQPEAVAAITCVQQLKPLLEQPSVQKLVGKHRNDVEIVLAGGIPRPICR